MHRVEEIRKLTQANNWRHCPGEWNPADLGSHGITASQLKERKVWWMGPEFLQSKEENWPKLGENVVQENEKALQEQVKKVTNTTNIFVTSADTNKTQDNNVIKCEEYSNIHRLLKVTFWDLITICESVFVSKSSVKVEHWLPRSWRQPEHCGYEPYSQANLPRNSRASRPIVLPITSDSSICMLMNRGSYEVEEDWRTRVYPWWLRIQCCCLQNITSRGWW